MVRHWQGFNIYAEPHDAIDWQMPKELVLVNGSKICLKKNKELDLITSEW